MKKLIFMLGLTLALTASCKNYTQRMGKIEIITDTGDRYEQKLMLPDSVQPGDYFVPEGQRDSFLVID